MNKGNIINSLTKEQEDLIPVYRDKWLKIGLSTDRIDQKEAERIVGNLYTNIFEEKPPKIIITSSPLESWRMINGTLMPIYHINFLNNHQIHLLEDYYTNRELGNRPGIGLPYFCGQFDVHFFSYYDYLIEVCGLKFVPQKLMEMWGIYKETTKLSSMYTYKGICILSDKPVEIHFEGGVLHKEGSPSILYSDGFACWNLHGVKVSKELAETPGEKLNPAILLTENNAEVRREIVRKIGIERILNLGTEILDEEKGYTLLRFNKMKVNNVYPVYLKMVNPSLGCYHIEEVKPDIKTVLEAIHFRKPKKLQEIPIDEKNGEEYYQQGDVIMWPEQAKCVKFWPAQLT